ncbi:hypothetical protein [Lactobacillus delbrueckii]|uniref:hypothetical protein n=1 Tax=Lactobacillus delbrueckii TaxID=1584 RepID=UPI001173F7AE|nr:hypothetical protein [Lactobacillus delbrueckii]GEA75312.1 hypothetical protein LDE03_11200 [Lactobacillus delbrueckii subsp. delbrueckii]
MPGKHQVCHRQGEGGPQYTGDDLTQLYHVFDESVREKYVNRDYVLTHFQEALDKLWIKPYYQMETRRREVKNQHPDRC